MLGWIAVAVLSLSDAGSEAPGAPAKPGPETKALDPLVGRFTLSGSAGPELMALGKQSCAWQLGVWLVCEIEDRLVSGKSAVVWQGRLIIGWDFDARAYRGTMVDNFGNAGFFGGKLEGTKLQLESLSEATYAGKPAKFRLTWDLGDKKAVRFVYERSLKDGEWEKVQEYVLKKSA